MKDIRFTAGLLAAFCGFGATLPVTAATRTDPLFSIGLGLNYTDVELDGKVNGKDFGLNNEQIRDRLGIPTKLSEDADAGHADLVLGWGNILTGDGGFLYQINGQGGWAKINDYEIKDAMAEAVIGWRAALGSSDFVDLTAGGGYQWTRFDVDYKANALGRSLRVDPELQWRGPYGKAGLGYNHKFSSTTFRLEVGARYSFNSKTKLDSDLEVNGQHPDSQTVDLDDRTNPYAELTFLWNQGGLPFYTSLYYYSRKYEPERNWKGVDKLEFDRDEAGLKFGLAF